MKHFALDEQETERLDISIWCNEQAMEKFILSLLSYAQKKVV